MALGLGIADKRTGAGYCEYRRDQREEDQDDDSPLELEAHCGPEQRRHNDVGEGQIAAERKGGDAEEDQPKDAGFRPSGRREFSLVAPVLDHDQRQRCNDQGAGGVSDPPERPGAGEGLRKYAEPGKSRASHGRARYRCNSRTQHDESENLLQGFQSDRSLQGPVDQQGTDHRLEGIADINQEGRRQRAVEPQDIAEQLGEASR